MDVLKMNEYVCPECGRNDNEVWICTECSFCEICGCGCDAEEDLTKEEWLKIYIGVEYEG